MDPHQLGRLWLCPLTLADALPSTPLDCTVRVPSIALLDIPGEGRHIHASRPPSLCSGRFLLYLPASWLADYLAAPAIRSANVIDPHPFEPLNAITLQAHTDILNMAIATKSKC